VKQSKFVGNAALRSSRPDELISRCEMERGFVNPALSGILPDPKASGRIKVTDAGEQPALPHHPLRGSAVPGGFGNLRAGRLAQLSARLDQTGSDFAGVPSRAHLVCAKGRSG
jgi:hypothetical protein